MTGRQLVMNPDGTLYLVEPDATGVAVFRCELVPVNHFDTTTAAIAAAASDPYPPHRPYDITRGRPR